MTDHDPTPAGALNRDAIAALISAGSGLPLLTDYVDLTSQLQANGFDITLQTVASFARSTGPGSIGASDEDRVIPQPEEMPFDSDGWLSLDPGEYLVTFNEVVNLPRWLMALGRPRSSLLRMGVTLHTAVWDAGYSGRSQALLVVHRPAGLRLQRNARIAQLVFFPLTAADAQGYTGRYQGENL